MKGILVRVDNSIEVIELQNGGSIEEFVGGESDVFGYFSVVGANVFGCCKKCEPEERTKYEPNQLALLIYTDYLLRDEKMAECRDLEEKLVKMFKEMLEDKLKGDIEEETNEAVKAKLIIAKDEVIKEAVAKLIYKERTKVVDEVYGDVVFFMGDKENVEDIIQDIMAVAGKYTDKCPTIKKPAIVKPVETKALLEPKPEPVKVEPVKEQDNKYRHYGERKLNIEFKWYTTEKNTKAEIEKEIGFDLKNVGVVSSDPWRCNMEVDWNRMEYKVLRGAWYKDDNGSIVRIPYKGNLAEFVHACEETMLFICSNFDYWELDDLCKKQLGRKYTPKMPPDVAAEKKKRQDFIWNAEHTTSASGLEFHFLDVSKMRDSNKQDIKLESNKDIAMWHKWSFSRLTHATLVIGGNVTKEIKFEGSGKIVQFLDSCEATGYHARRKSDGYWLDAISNLFRNRPYEPYSKIKVMELKQKEAAKLKEAEQQAAAEKAEKKSKAAIKSSIQSTGGTYNVDRTRSQR